MVYNLFDQPFFKCYFRFDFGCYKIEYMTHETFLIFCDCEILSISLHLISFVQGYVFRLSNQFFSLKLESTTLRLTMSLSLKTSSILLEYGVMKHHERKCTCKCKSLDGKSKRPLGFDVVNIHCLIGNTLDVNIGTTMTTYTYQNIETKKNGFKDYNCNYHHKCIYF